MKKSQVENLVKDARKVRKGWFNRLTETLKEKGVKFSETEICSNGYHSGDVIERKGKILVFNWGRGVKARSGFNYNLYPIIEIEA